MYTDDTSIYHSSKDIAQLNAVLNEEIWRLDRWLKRNNLSFNVAKTRSMLITTMEKKRYLTASNQALQPTIREEHMEVIYNIKYLGVQIEENEDIYNILMIHLLILRKEMAWKVSKCKVELRYLYEEEDTRMMMLMS